MKALRVLPPQSEKRVQRAVVELYELVGGFVYNLSQARASHQTEGLPDLIVFLPARGTHYLPAQLIVVAHEVKRQGGMLRRQQEEFRDRWIRAGRRHVVGGVAEAKELLVDINLIERT